MEPIGVAFDGLFAREDGTARCAGKVTGNDAQTLTPSATDWYETIKLNYSYDLATGTLHSEPRPDTWAEMDDILAY